MVFKNKQVLVALEPPHDAVGRRRPLIEHFIDRGRQGRLFRLAQALVKLFVAVEHLGEMELAATNVIRSVSTVFFVIVNSLAATTGSLVSNLLGAGQKAQVIPLCNRVVRLGYAIGFPLVILAVIFYRPIVGIYTESTVLMQIAHLPFVVMLLNYVFALPGYVYMNAVTGIGATRMTFIFQLITIVAYQIYLWSISGFSTSLSVYWTAEYLYVILLGLLSVIYLKYKHY